MTREGRRSIRNAYASRCPHSSCGRESFLTMTTPKFKTQFQFLLKKLLPANTPPRKMASQLRRRIKNPRVDYSLYKEAYHLYEEANPPETPRTRRDKLKIVFLDCCNRSLFRFHLLFRLASALVYRVWVPLSNLTTARDLIPSV